MLKSTVNSSDSWSLKRQFRFESRVSLENVVHSLSALEPRDKSLNTSRREISILPMPDGYTFTYRIRRRSRSTNYTSASAEGRVWKDNMGTVLEGTAQIDPLNFYSSVGFLMFVAGLFILSARTDSMCLLVPLVIFVVPFVISTYYQDLNLVYDGIQGAVEQALSAEDSFSTLKEKDAYQTEKAKNMPLNAPNQTRPDSVWNEAISEYEDDETNRDGR